MRTAVTIVLAAALAGCGTPDTEKGDNNGDTETRPATQPAAQAASAAPDLTKLEVGEEVTLFNGTDLTGWRLVKEIFFDRPGPVTVKDGNLVLGKGEDLTGVAWKGPVLRDGYEISFEARRVEGMDFFCGFTFPVGTGDLTLILGGWGGCVIGLTAIDSFSAAENETTRSREFELKKWYPVRVRVADDSIQVFLEGEKIIDQERTGHQFEVWPQMEEARPLSFSTYATVGEYRNIVYKRLTD